MLVPRKKGAPPKKAVLLSTVADLRRAPRHRSSTDSTSPPRDSRPLKRKRVSDSLPSERTSKRRKIDPNLAALLVAPRSMPRPQRSTNFRRPFKDPSPVATTYLTSTDPLVEPLSLTVGDIERLESRRFVVLTHLEPNHVSRLREFLPSPNAGPKELPLVVPGSIRCFSWRSKWGALLETELNAQGDPILPELGITATDVDKVQKKLITANHREVVVSHLLAPDVSDQILVEYFVEIGPLRIVRSKERATCRSCNRRCRKVMIEFARFEDAVRSWSWCGASIRGSPVEIKSPFLYDAYTW